MSTNTTLPEEVECRDTRLAFDLVPIGLCLSRKRSIEHCNSTFAAMFGYTLDELRGNSLECLYPTVTEFENIGRRGYPVMTRSGRYEDNRIMKRRNGELFWCHVMGRSLNASTPFACAAWTFQDISKSPPVGTLLTAREREISQYIVVGKTSKQIATALNISPRTVEAHRARLMHKLGASGPGEVVAKLVGLM